LEGRGKKEKHPFTSGEKEKEERRQGWGAREKGDGGHPSTLGTGASADLRVPTSSKGERKSKRDALKTGKARKKKYEGLMGKQEKREEKREIIS